MSTKAKQAVRARREIVLHSPRKSKHISKLDIAAIEDQFQNQGFVSVWLHPRIYIGEEKQYKPLIGQGMACRVFSMDALQKLIQGIEGACGA
jgi:hypothetical protein